MTFFCICGLGSEQKQFKSTVVCASPVVKSLEFSPSPVPPEETAPLPGLRSELAAKAFNVNRENKQTTCQVPDATG